MLTKLNATVEDLYHIDGKAELINGEIVEFMATGRMPIYAASEIFVSLRQFIRQHKLAAIAVPDNAGFVVNLPRRQSFSPDAAYYEGPNSGMRFFVGAPKFAVEVRSENDYGPVAEMEMAEKRTDYFSAGTQVVWDIDLLSENVVRKYIASCPTVPEIFVRTAIADAEPAIPGWTMVVADLFE